MRTASGQNRQTRIGHAGQADWRSLGQGPQMLAHLGGPGGAVQTDHVNLEWFKCGQGRADLGPQEHRPGGLDRHLGNYDNVLAANCHGTLGTDNGGLRL